MKIITLKFVGTGQALPTGKSIALNARYKTKQQKNPNKQYKD